ncbi:DUF2617 family protein [Halocatena marina]|uniref:DUF2617 family protein n=1 Tax=Halocatena marina TaxID=2934937 RepID=A0ABD5YVG5_9EURY|nr:DUF2617 family protein [Halocatena marina]
MTTPTPTALYFVYTPTPPNLDHFEVKRVASTEILGRPATLTVIGESHCISIRALGVHELCSCKPLPAETMHCLPLTEALAQSFSAETEHCSVSTTIETHPLDSFPDEHKQNADVSYRFGPDAWTTIIVEEDAYETYHTYPECDLTLYTQTRLQTEPADNPDRECPSIDVTHQ